LFLSNLAASDTTSTLNKEKVEAIAKSANIKKVEIETIKRTLKDFHLIDVSSTGDISVIGVTTAGVLGHTANIFDNSSPDNFQKASLELANYSSDKPVNEKLLKEFIADSFKLDKTANQDLFNQSEEIGLIDYEIIDSQKTYFNGNLFKRDNIEKTTKILSSLTSDESKKVN
jgi:intergrase/recombinase